jgi:hypothetical protein
LQYDGNKEKTLLRANKVTATASNVKAPSGRRPRNRRYEFRGELRFSYRRRDSLFYGSGRTKDLGDGGVLFEADQQLPPSGELELRILWPVSLQEICALELVVRGPILRSDRHGSVLRVDSCEFQTCGDRSFDQTSVGEGFCSVLA